MWGCGPLYEPPSWPPSASTIASSPLCPQKGSSSHPSLLFNFWCLSLHLGKIPKALVWQTRAHLTLAPFLTSSGAILPSPSSLHLDGLLSYLQTDHPYGYLGATLCSSFGLGIMWLQAFILWGLKSSPRSRSSPCVW